MANQFFVNWHASLTPKTRKLASNFDPVVKRLFALKINRLENILRGQFSTPKGVKLARQFTEQERSEISQVDFCKEKNLKIHQFHYYLKLLKDESIHPEEINNKVVPIKIKSAQNSSIKEYKEIRVLLQNGMQCIFPSDMPVEQISGLIKVLLSC